jgi:FMN phosphatase YigB (HAD superfamily)
MNSIDKSKYSELVEFLDKRDIRAVGFDIDNTLLQTGEYYDQAWTSLGVKLALMIDNTGDPSVIAEDIRSIAREAYNSDGRKPKLIQDRYFSALKDYLGCTIPKDMGNLITETLEDFYLKSPVPFNSSADVIRIFIENNREIVLHSHAQEEWTKIKVELLEREVGHSLPYLSTPIKETKDSKSWLKALDIIQVAPINTLIVGDNLEADIKPSREIGCKTLVWKNRYNAPLPKELNFEDDVDLIVIEDIGELIMELSNRA